MSLALVFAIGRSTAYPLQAQAPLRLIIRKAVHVGEYAFLGFVALQCLSGRRRWVVWPRILGVLTLIGLVGIVDEWLQQFVPGRVPRVADVGIDLLGGSVGVVLWLSLRWVASLCARGSSAAGGGHKKA